jgi:hypothetical protein
MNSDQFQMYKATGLEPAKEAVTHCRPKLTYIVQGHWA